MIKPDADAILEEIWRFLEENRNHLAEGNEAKLAGLDGKVAELCKMASSLEGEEKQHFSAHLGELLHALADFEQLLKDNRDQVLDQIEGLNRFKKASVAYKTSDVIRPEDRKSEWKDADEEE